MAQGTQVEEQVSASDVTPSALRRDPLVEVDRREAINLACPCLADGRCQENHGGIRLESCPDDGHRWTEYTQGELRVQICDHCGNPNWHLMTVLVQNRADTRSQQIKSQAQVNQAFARLWSDLDRCPHGRHEGDTCGGWRGPGQYDGGCEGGQSLGNPAIQTGQLVGYTMGSMPIRMPSRLERHVPSKWADQDRVAR